MDFARVKVCLDGGVDQFVLLNQALADELFRFDTHGQMVATGAHKIVDTGTASRQVRLD